jgi:hypothetical protein
MAVALRRETRDELYRRRLAGMVKTAPFVLRITRWRELTGPVLVVKERTARRQVSTSSATRTVHALWPRKSANLVERGHIAGEPQRRVQPVLRSILARVRDEAGMPLHLQRWMTMDGLRQTVTLPVDEEAGAKLAVVFRLHERITDLDRVELIARRVDRLTREEATYLLSRMTRFDPATNRWAMAGLRIMLGGQAKDPAVRSTLDLLRGT